MAAGATEVTKIILRIAAPRSGVCTRTDLLAAGVSGSTLNRRIKAGFLTPVRSGVYVCDALATESTRWHVAAASVSDAIISHISAGEINRLPIEPPQPGSPVHVIAANNAHRRLAHVVIHRLRRLPADEDLITHDGLAVTAPARTIVDLASMIGPARLRHIAQTQAVKRDPPLEDLVACFDSIARSGVNGVANMRAVLTGLVTGGPVPHSELERAVAAMLARSAVTGFIAQYRPPWYDGIRDIVDFANPDLRLVLEADGRNWHTREQEMANDRRRDRQAIKHGWATVRFTWGEVTKRRAATAADLTEIVASRTAELNNLVPPNPSTAV